MGVIEITSKEDWAQKHAEAKNSQKPVCPRSACSHTLCATCWPNDNGVAYLSAQIIVDFSATWCGPCRLISPYFDELSTQYPGIIFLKVDVDAVDVRCLLLSGAVHLCGWV